MATPQICEKCHNILEDVSYSDNCPAKKLCGSCMQSKNKLSTLLSQSIERQMDDEIQETKDEAMKIAMTKIKNEWNLKRVRLFTNGLDPFDKTTHVGREPFMLTSKVTPSTCQGKNYRFFRIDPKKFWTLDNVELRIKILKEDGTVVDCDRITITNETSPPPMNETARAVYDLRMSLKRRRDYKRAGLEEVMKQDMDSKLKKMGEENQEKRQNLEEECDAYDQEKLSNQQKNFEAAIGMSKEVEKTY